MLIITFCVCQYYRHNIGLAIEEMKRPERYNMIWLKSTSVTFLGILPSNLPWALVLGLVTVSICYLLVNLSFFAVLSYDEITAAETVALVSYF